MSQYVDRYNAFRVNANMKPVVGIPIPESGSDKTMVYKLGLTRLDKLSQMYYNNPYSGWVIMLANPQFGGLEFNIPDMTLIRIPFPFDSAIGRYNEQVTKHRVLYGE